MCIHKKLGYSVPFAFFFFFFPSFGGGNEQIFGSLFEDEIWGGPGDDTIEGDEGNDIIYGNGGNDFMLGGPGKVGRTQVFVLSIFLLSMKERPVAPLPFSPQLYAFESAPANVTGTELLKWCI